MHSTGGQASDRAEWSGPKTLHEGAGPCVRSSHGETFDGGGTRSGDSGHRRDRLRPRPAASRHPAQLPDPRPCPLLPRGGGPRAASVHRDQQHRGTSVQSRAATVDLRVVEAGEQLLRVRHQQGPRDVAELLHHQALAVPDPVAGAGCAGLRRSLPDPGRQGARRWAWAFEGVPARVGDQRLGDELRRAVVERDRCAQPGGEDRRVPPQHRRGRHLATPSPGWRPGVAVGKRLLRRPRRARPVRPRLGWSTPSRRTRCERSRSS